MCQLNSTSVKRNQLIKMLNANLIIVLLMLSGFLVLGIEARPMSNRSKRSPISQMISTDKLSNPCGVISLDCSQQDNDAEITVLDANLAKDKIETLLTVSGPAFSCYGLELNEPIPMPSINSQMTKVEKLREIYKSLVHHSAFLQAIASQQTARDPTLLSLQQSIGILQNVQCSMECIVGFSASEKSTLVTSATTRVYPTGQDSSRDSMHTCVVGNQLLKLLDTLIEIGRAHV